MEKSNHFSKNTVESISHVSSASIPEKKEKKKKKEVEGAWWHSQVTLSPAAPGISYWYRCLCCSTSDMAFCLWTGKTAEDGLSPWSPHLHGIPSRHFWLLALDHLSHDECGNFASEPASRRSSLYDGKASFSILPLFKICLSNKFFKNSFWSANDEPTERERSKQNDVIGNSHSPKFRNTL